MAQPETGLALGRRAVAVLSLAVLALAACTPKNVENRKQFAASDAVVVSARGARAIMVFPELPPRQTRGQGAAEGALGAAGETVGMAIMDDPFAIILLPIMIPVGAVWGAATAPDDKDWARIEARYKRLKDTQTRIARRLAGNNTAADVQRHLADAIGVTPSFQGKCVAVAGRKSGCTAGSVTRIDVLTRPKITGEGYVLETATSVRGPGSSECIQHDFEKSYSRAFLAGEKTEAEILREISQMNRGFGLWLANELFEAPQSWHSQDTASRRWEIYALAGYPKRGTLPCP